MQSKRPKTIGKGQTQGITGSAPWGLGLSRSLHFCLLMVAGCLWPGCFSAPVSAQPPRVTVRVAAETVARRERLLLGDLALIKAGSPEAEARLRQVALGYAPNVGAVREIGRDKILLALAAAGFPENAVNLEAPPSALIRRAAQTVDAGAIREAVERAALGELKAKGATARLVRLDLPPQVEVAAGEVEVRAALGTTRDLYAPFTVFIELWLEGNLAHRFAATAQVEAHAPVVVAARPIAPNTRLRADNTKVEVRRLERPITAYLTDPNRLRGTSASRVIAQGEAITANLLVAEYVIKPGDQVRILGELAGTPRKLQIAVSGEAKGAGRIGDRILVKNLQSGATLQATVVDEGCVRVQF